jgi:hypothetical protein
MMAGELVLDRRLTCFRLSRINGKSRSCKSWRRIAQESWSSKTSLRRVLLTRLGMLVTDRNDRLDGGSDSLTRRKQARWQHAAK